MKFVLVKRKTLIKIVAFTMLSVIAIAVLFSTPLYTVFYGYTLKKLPIYSVDTDEKKVAISFDCAWGVDYTDTLLKVMQEEDVKCTFFMVEFWAKKYPDYVKKISDFGHEIGTHSSTHPNMSKLDKTAIEKELKTSSTIIEEITGKKVELFRPPFGDYDDLVIDTAKEMGLFTIQWSVDSLDWKNLSKSEIINRVVNKVKNGSIVLFHNQGLHTHEALPEIIRTLKNKGYTFVPIGELIYRENYKMLPDGTQQKTK